VATVDLSKTGFANDEIRSLYDMFFARVSGLPQTEQATLSSGSILGSAGVGQLIAFRTALNGRPSEFYRLTAVSPQYFSTLGIRILRGRSFTAGDDGRSAPVMIMDDVLAKETWPNGDATGKCVFFTGSQACTQVVGISESPSEGPIASASGQLHVPLAQVSLHRVAGRVLPRTLIVRTRQSPEKAIGPIALAIRSALPNVPYANVRPLADLADVRTRSWRLGTQMFGLFSSLAVIMAAVGLYVILAFSTHKRTPEIGVRMALGATQAAIIATVARQGLILVTTGWATGAIASMFLTRFIRSALFNVAPTDLGTFIGASAIIFIAAVAATVVPAYRAARVEPAAALRCE
jgi:hypothetical protein